MALPMRRKAEASNFIVSFSEISEAIYYRVREQKNTQYQGTGDVNMPPYYDIMYVTYSTMFLTGVSTSKPEDV